MMDSEQWEETLKKSDQKENVVYRGHKIPFVIIVAWFILILWIVFYLVSFALPDLKNWLLPR